MTGHWARAGAAYFAGVFGAGFALGTLRVLFVEERAGPVLSVVLETPVMLAIAWFVAGFAVRRFQVAGAASARIAMGALALVLLVAAETALASAGFGVPVAEHFAGYVSARGAVTAFGQIVFALIPLAPGEGRRRLRALSRPCCACAAPASRCSP